MQQLIIIGGGAAGIFCAANAARLAPHLKVMVLEKSSKLLAKVKVSGGGRCNVTHNEFDVNELIKKYPRGKNFLKKELFQFTPKDTVEWFESRGVNIQAEADGRMFPASNSSQTIIDCLLAEANKHHVEIRMNTGVSAIEKESGRFLLHTPAGVLKADYVVIACGGFPKAEQFDWIRNLQHTIEPPAPSLFTFNAVDSEIKKLMGVSAPSVEVKIAGTKLKEKGAVLITHWGFSGPGVLRLSAWGARALAEKAYSFSLQINWSGRYNENTLREEWNNLRNRYAVQKTGNKNPFELPQRLWHYLLQRAAINPDTVWNALSSTQQNKLIQILTSDTYAVKGKTTFKEEFVTCGGIGLQEINPQTMESRLHSHLFFAGEIMDVDGITGGFNFQHAWASGIIAARNIAERCTG